MVSQYHLVLLPPKDILDQIRKMAEDREAVLDDVKVRVEWKKHVLAQAKKDREEEEREKRKFLIALEQKANLYSGICSN